MKRLSAFSCLDLQVNMAFTYPVVTDVRFGKPQWWLVLQLAIQKHSERPCHPHNERLS